MHRLSSTTRAAMRTVTLRCEPTMPSCEQASDRLRSWAVVSDVPHEGAPFVRVEGDEWSAHIVTSSDSPGDPQAGILVSETPAQQLLIVDDVRFDAIHTVLRELEQVVLAAMKYDRQGAPEFHSLEGAFIVGTLPLPLTAPLASPTRSRRGAPVAGRCRRRTASQSAHQAGALGGRGPPPPSSAPRSPVSRGCP